MPEATLPKRKWAPCVCPICRFVFRIPNQHSGKGVVCPACQYLLKTPDSNSKVVHDVRETPKPIEQQKVKSANLPLGTTTQTMAGATNDHQSRRSSSTGRRRVRVEHRGKNETPDWEQQPSPSEHVREEQGSPVPWILGGSLLGLSILGIAAWLVLGDEGKKPEREEGDLPSVSNLSSTPIEQKVELSPEEIQQAEKIRNSINTGIDILEETKILVTDFLSVTDVENFQGLVRNPELSMPRIREWYKSNPLKSLDVKHVGYRGQVTVNKNVASITIQMQDFTVKQMAIEKGDDGYRVDWESWVAWTELSWDEFFKQKPKEPKTVLVTCSKDSYYNRQFSDDKKWAAVKLINPQSYRTLYGYVDRDDPSLERFLTDLNSGAVSVTLKIRYPDDALADNQVQVIEHVRSGWIHLPEPDEEENN